MTIATQVASDHSNYNKLMNVYKVCNYKLFQLLSVTNLVDVI